MYRYDGETLLKIRHILFGLLAMLAVAFMQPLITFLGGLTLLIGVGALIFRGGAPDAGLVAPSARWFDDGYSSDGDFPLPDLRHAS